MLGTAVGRSRWATYAHKGGGGERERESLYMLSKCAVCLSELVIQMRQSFKWTKPVFCFHGCFKPNAFGFRCAMTSSSSALADRRTRPTCSHRLQKYISFMVSNQWVANCSGRYLNWFAQFFYRWQDPSLSSASWRITKAGWLCCKALRPFLHQSVTLVFTVVAPHEVTDVQEYLITHKLFCGHLDQQQRITLCITAVDGNVFTRIHKYRWCRANLHQRMLQAHVLTGALSLCYRFDSYQPGLKRLSSVLSGLGSGSKPWAWAINISYVTSRKEH